MKEIADITLPLDLPYKDLVYIKKIIEPLDSVLIRYTACLDENTTYERIGQLNYSAIYFIDHKKQVKERIEQMRMLNGEPSLKEENRKLLAMRISITVEWIIFLLKRKVSQIINKTLKTE